MRESMICWVAAIGNPVDALRCLFSRAKAQFGRESVGWQLRFVIRQAGVSESFANGLSGFPYFNLKEEHNLTGAFCCVICQTDVIEGLVGALQYLFSQEKRNLCRKAGSCTPPVSRRVSQQFLGGFRGGLSTVSWWFVDNFSTVSRRFLKGFQGFGCLHAYAIRFVTRKLR